MTKFKVLFTALSVLFIPGIAQAAPSNVVAYNCIFPRDVPAGQSPKFDYLAVLIPNWLAASINTPFEVIDPTHLLKGGAFSRLVKKETSFALAGSQTDKIQMLLISIDTDKPAVFDAVLGDRNTPDIRRNGQCAALGEKAQESFDFWKKHPDRIGDAP